MKITVSNNGPATIYLYIIDIKPDETMKLELKHMPIHANSKKVLNGEVSCGDSKNPCGKEQIKIICSMQKIPIDPLLRIGKSLNSNRGNGNPLEEFIKKEIEGTRSWNVDKKINILTEDIIFEINN